MIIKRFEDLEIWKEARELCKLVYRVTSQEPFCHDFRFRDQMRASAGSSMDIIPKDSKEEEIKNFSSFFLYQKDPAGK
jgi:four helix bundle protein